MLSLYSCAHVGILNKLVKTRGKIRSAISQTALLKAFIGQRTLPKFVKFRIEKSSVRQTPNTERAFTHDEIEKSKSLITFLKGKFRALWQEVRHFLSFFDFIQFYRYIATIHKRKERELSINTERKLKFLFQQRFGNMAKPNKDTIINLSNYKLSPTEEFVLSHGLNFYLPPHSVQREEIFAEFEVLIGQLLHHVPHSSEQFSALKARLSDFAHAYCGNPINIGDFPILKECIQATRSLRCNENIHVTKPDKGSGVVIMNKNDYISKMHFTLRDNSKFENLGLSSEFDNTAKIEAHIQKRLLQLKKEGLLPSKIYSRIRPTGSQRPRMYGLPKIHKQHVPLRPTLSMTDSAQHQLAQWLTLVIDPVLSLYSTHFISDSFTFADKVRTFNFPPSVFLCS